MRILGANLGRTRYGKLLKDGGACVAEDGQIRVAIAEERLSRLKSAGGFDRSARYCLEYLGDDIGSVDLAVLSSCCETVRTVETLTELHLPDSKRIVTVGHHLSHAYSSFWPSHFDEALVVVMDAGGNLLTTGNEAHWWKHPREQNSYYLGRGSNLKLIDRDFAGPFEAGFGEVYRAFTHFLGWHSYTLSGNTMALAALGDPEAFRRVRVFEVRDGHLRSSMKAEPGNPIDMVRQFATCQLLPFPQPRHECDDITQEHIDVARLVQESLEEALTEKVRHLLKATGMKNVCLAGGVALNCVANTRLLEELPIEGLFVQPAAGDTGQCLGNAYYGMHLLGHRRTVGGEPFNPFLGKHASSPTTPPEVLEGIALVEEDTLSHVASRIAQGKLIAFFQGRSEFGPRALGNRSILADPRDANTRKRLLEIKGRDWFMPFAPSVLAEYQSDYFDIDVASPYMLLAPRVKLSKRHEIPAVTHFDGTARLQTVTQGGNPVFHRLITEFCKLTGIPMVLNTSLNRRGEPIAETFEDAWQIFVHTDIDCLYADGQVFEKVPQHRALVPVG